MKQMPYRGGTFPDAQISEAGRRLLLCQLQAINDDQVLALFRTARFENFAGHDEHAWARVFHDKVDQIAAAGPCPPD